MVMSFSPVHTVPPPYYTISADVYQAVVRRNQPVMQFWFVSYCTWDLSSLRSLDNTDEEWHVLAVLLPPLQDFTRSATSS